MIRTHREWDRSVGRTQVRPSSSRQRLSLTLPLEDTREIQAKCACGGGCPRCRQDDPREREADRGADELVSRTPTASLAAPETGPMGVRIHTDGQAADTARALNARAYTIGRDIFFGEGRYQPETLEGRRLLAHELVHTVQQEREGRSLQKDDEPAQAAEPANGALQIEWRSRGQWRTRVDAAVRALFGLSGPGLTATRVRLVRPAAFPAQIPAATLAETLLDLFLAPPPMSNFYSILRYHQVGLAGIGALRTFIDERIAAGSFMWADVTPFGGRTVHTITPQALVAQTLGGITSVSGPRAGRRVVVPVPAYVETLVHEACHFYVHSGFRNRANRDGDSTLVGFRKSYLLMEGFAEYFSRRVMEANRETFGPVGIRAYEPEVELAARIIETMGQAAARAAYFEGDSSALDRLDRSVELNRRYYPLMVAPFMIP